VDPRAGLDRCGKSRPHRDFDLRTLQPVASRYSDYATRPITRIIIIIIVIINLSCENTITLLISIIERTRVRTFLYSSLLIEIHGAIDYAEATQGNRTCRPHPTHTPPAVTFPTSLFFNNFPSSRLVIPFILALQILCS
jgi:hypothetical protein